VGKNAKKAQNEMMSIWGKNEIFDELEQQQQQVVTPTLFFIMMVVIQRCAKCSNESVSTTQIVLSSKNNITERKSTTRAGGLMPKNQPRDKQTGDVNFSGVKSCWTETYFYDSS
jgi:hypothetical protein